MAMSKRILFLVFILILTGCSPLKKTEKTIEIMGTFATITVYSKDKNIAKEAIEKAFNEIKRIDKIMSIYKNTSPIYKLNKDGEIYNVSNDIIFVIKKALKYGDLTEGAFDISVQPILELYKHTFKDLNRSPTEDEIKDTLKLVNYNNVIIQYKSIKLKKRGMKITLGGIAKGYAIDKAIEVLKENNIKHALVNIGGDMRAIGNKGKENWQIALQNPRNRKEYITIIRINNKSVCTSGDYERYFDASKKFHHIINPKTGHSADELISVTIITNKAIDCDALATSVFVLGKVKGLELVERLENVEALIITNNRNIIKSSGFQY